MNVDDVIKAIGEIQTYKRQIYRIISETENGALLNGDRQRMRELLLKIELGLLLIEEAIAKNVEN